MTPSPTARAVVRFATSLDPSRRRGNEEAPTALLSHRILGLYRDGGRPPDRTLRAAADTGERRRGDASEAYGVLSEGLRGRFHAIDHGLRPGLQSELLALPPLRGRPRTAPGGASAAGPGPLARRALRLRGRDGLPSRDLGGVLLPASAALRRGGLPGVFHRRPRGSGGRSSRRRVAVVSSQN